MGILGIFHVRMCMFVFITGNCKIICGWLVATCQPTLSVDVSLVTVVFFLPIINKSKMIYDLDKNFWCNSPEVVLVTAKGKGSKA